MFTPIQVIERVTRLTPLGLRFWDPISQSLIGSGLAVTAYPLRGTPPERTGSSRSAIVNRAAVYSFTGLPGLRQLENGAGDDAFWGSLPVPGQFEIEVLDTEGRFLPCQFIADAPSKGIFELFCGSPPTLLTSQLTSPLSSQVYGVPLFSSPSRPIAAGMATIRATLYDSERNRPAAYALLEVQAPDQSIWRGMADQEGRVLLNLPYPEPVTPPLGSPLGSPLDTRFRPLWQQQWTLPIQAFYSPVAADTPAATLPDLCQVLTQAPAILWDSQPPNSPALPPLSEITLLFGAEAILRSYITMRN